MAQCWSDSCALETVLSLKVEKKMDLCVEVRTVIREARNKITSCQTAQEMSDIISQFTDLLSSSDKENVHLNGEPSSLGIRYTPSFKQEFLRNHFSQFCEHVLRSIDPKFLDDEKVVATALKRLFMEGPADLSFLVLVSSISATSHTKILHLIVLILDCFASDGKFVELLYSQCVSQSRECLSQDVLLLLATLPDKLANKMKLSLNAKFHPNIYYKMLANELLKTLVKVHEFASASMEYTTSFLSSLVGKVALRGSVDIFLDVLLPQFKKWSYTSPLWANLCSQILMNVPESAMEPILETLLKKITFYPFFCKLLKDSIHTKTLVHHLITYKFLFIRYYRETNVLQNIIGYLCGAGRRTILLETLGKLLIHWGNYNTIKHSSYAQHFYTTQAIILSIVQANEQEIAQHKQVLLHTLLSGVQAHLERPNSKVRQLGMITAECMTSFLHPGSQKLQFEYDEDDTFIKKLRILAKSPKFGVDMEKENFLNKSSDFSQENLGMDEVLSKVSKNLDSNGIMEKKEASKNDDEDDLQPFEITEDDHDLIEGIRPPRYISECIDGLLSADDPKRSIASLQVLRKVIMADADNFHHLSVQLVTALLYLQDQYSLEDYYQLRFSSMVAATVGCPIPVAGYLTKEFYAPNYSLRQRMDILDVLIAAAAELSTPQPRANTEDPESLAGVPKGAKVKNWQTIIEERVEKKTRRFGKKNLRETPKAMANQFAPVAGHFFFPLLQGFDSRQNTFDLLGEDCMVLGSLVYTVGNIMYCARGTFVAQTMAKTLLEFVWVLRYHNDSHVRQALLFAVAMAILSVPDFFLMAELQDELAECQNWLENILSNDPSFECRNLALQVLVSVRDVFKRQFSPSSS